MCKLYTDSHLRVDSNPGPWRCEAAVLTTEPLLTFYRAVVVPALLNGSETWTVNSRYLKALELYHRCGLRKTLRIHWEERCANASILNQANVPSFEKLATIDSLRRAGHIICMTDMRLPEQVLYSQLQNGRRGPEGQRKRFSDILKASLAKCGIPTGTWESPAQDSPKWRRSIWEGIEHLEIC
eukprot:g29291.t1